MGIPYSTMNKGVRLYGPHAHTNRDCPKSHPTARFDGRHMLHLRTMSHKAQNIGDVLVGWLSKPHSRLTSRQQHYIRELEQLTRQHPAAHAQTFSEAVLRAHFVVLDKIFFDGTLAEHVVLGVHASKRGAAGDAGNTRFSRVGKPRVRMDVYDFGHWAADPEQRRAKVLAVLIHEAIHAFWLVHGCEGRGCATWRAIERHEGFTGHGPDFYRCNEAANGFVLRHLGRCFPGGYDPGYTLLDRYAGMERDVASELRAKYNL